MHIFYYPIHLLFWGRMAWESLDWWKKMSSSFYLWGFPVYVRYTQKQHMHHSLCRCLVSTITGTFVTCSLLLCQSSNFKYFSGTSFTARSPLTCGTKRRTWIMLPLIFWHVQNLLNKELTIGSNANNAGVVTQGTHCRHPGSYLACGLQRLGLVCCLHWAR